MIGGIVIDPWSNRDRLKAFGVVLFLIAVIVLMLVSA